jgi:photoactive yellow protein
MSFVSEEIIDNLEKFSQKDIDLFDLGIVKVDDTGKVILYNKYEGELGETNLSEAEGKNFFTDVAPCTNNRLIKGKFLTGVANGELDIELAYTFTYKIQPTNVLIRLYHDKNSKSNWIFILRDD